MSLNHRLAEDDPNRNSIQWRAEIGLLPSFLHVNEIAELWAKGTKFAKESYVKVLKENIEDGELACMTKGQWVTLSEERRKRLSHTRPPKITPPASGNNIVYQLPPMELVLYGTIEKDLVPQDRIGGNRGDTSEMSDHDKKMAAKIYMVNRIEFKKWLQKDKKWPLPDKCLLARWWDSAEGDDEADTLQAAATKQQEKAIQVLIKRVLQENPEASTVKIWNKLKEYDTDGIIEEQKPKCIEKIAGNEDAHIRYIHPVRATAYAPIKLKAFQERCTKARKELGLKKINP